MLTFLPLFLSMTPLPLCNLEIVLLFTLGNPVSWISLWVMLAIWASFTAAFSCSINSLMCLICVIRSLLCSVIYFRKVKSFTAAFSCSIISNDFFTLSWTFNIWTFSAKDIVTSLMPKNRSSRLLGHVNFDGQNHRFVRKGNKNGFIYEFGHYFPDFGYMTWPSNLQFLKKSYNISRIF